MVPTHRDLPEKEDVNSMVDRKMKKENKREKLREKERKINIHIDR